MKLPLMADPGTRTKLHGRVGGPVATFLLPEDVSIADVRFLRSVCARVGIDADRVNWVQEWSDVATPRVVSFGKSALDVWHQWGVVRVTDHGTLFYRSGDIKHWRDHWIMVCEHPAGVQQQTAWGYGVRENLIADLGQLAMILEGAKQESELMGTVCLKCLHARDRKVRRVEGYVWGADGIAVCDDHWRKRSMITKVAKKRVNPSSKDAQIDGQMEGFG